MTKAASTGATKDTATDNAQAAGLMTISMAFFAVEDMFVKRSTESLPPGEVLTLMGLAGGLIFWAIAAANRQKVISKDALRGAALARTLAESVGAGLYVVALAFASLSMTSALLQASPLVVVAGAALFLREKVGWRRWASIVAGFIGVLIILSPWDASFDPTGILTVLCVLALAVRDLATRVMPARIGSFAVSSWAYLGMVPAGLFVTAFFGDSFVWPSLSQWTGMSIALVSGLIGYYAVVAAMRIGEVSVVAPFRYSRLVFAVILAILFFNESPALSTYIGAGIVVASGLYAFARERMRAKARAKADLS